MSEELDKEFEPKTNDEPEDKKEPKKAEPNTDVEALKKALAEEIAEKVRKEEKDKLYASFEKYKEDAKTAAAEAEAAKKALKEYEEKNLSVEEQASLRYKELQESNERLTNQMKDLIETANSKINGLQLELAKKELLTKYGDEIIPELVSGGTLEELAESAEKAHRGYVAIKDKELAKAAEAAKPKTQIGGGIAPSNDKLNVSPSIADIKNITDPKEFEKLLPKLLEDAIKG